MHFSVSRAGSAQSVRSLLAAGMVVLLLSACQSTSEKIGQFAIPAAQVNAQQSSAPQSPLATTAQSVEGGALRYQLQPGDQLDVKFFYNPELNEQLVVGPDQNVSLQLIGVVNVAGMSVADMSDALTRRYGTILRQPEATVILRKYAVSRIFVAGEVNNPAAYALDSGPLTAFQAIVQSGGFRKGAERANVIVLRASGAGKPQFIKLDLQSHLEQTAEADLLLRPYDIVYVPQRRIAEIADFFDEYFNKIVPIYRNLGFSFVYDVNNKNGTTR